jgi:hypothetical protein
MDVFLDTVRVVFFDVLRGESSELIPEIVYMFNTGPEQQKSN